MSAKIEYKEGELINGIKLIRLRPDVIKGGKRCADFECPKCHKIWTSAISELRRKDGKRSQSCGCAKGELFRKTHGMSDTKLYYTWFGMMQRCNNPNSSEYFRYGGRGITVCEKWEDIVAFVRDVSELPNYLEEGFTLDRKDINGNYEPNNVRWATKSTQSANQRKQEGSVYTGVFHSRVGCRWESRIRWENNNIHLGCFNTPREACIARDQFIKDHNLADIFPLQILKPYTKQKQEKHMKCNLT